MNNNNIYMQMIIDFNALNILKNIKKENDNLNKDIRKESSLTF
jgi:hypothetical protein